MEVSSSSCSSPLSLHRLDLAPLLLTRPVSRFSSKPLTRFTPSSTCTTSSSSVSASSSSSYFGVSISYKPSKSKNNYTLLRKRRGSFYIVSGVFERFTERAIKAVMFSHREAKGLGKDMVFTQHLLLGLIAEDRAPGGFLESGITIDIAREAVRSIWDDDEGDKKEEDDGLGAAATSTSATDVSFSNSTKRVFEAAVEYSRTMGYKFIAPEHIAIGLLTVDDGSASRVLKK